MHLILLSGGSKGEVLLWDLSSSTVSTLTPIFPTAPSPSTPAATTSLASHAVPRAVGTSTANPPLRDAVPGARLKTSERRHPIRPATCSSPSQMPTRPFFGRASDSFDVASVFSPGGTQPATARPGDEGDEVQCLASAALASVAGAGGGDAWWNSIDTAGCAFQNGQRCRVWILWMRSIWIG